MPNDQTSNKNKGFTSNEDEDVEQNQQGMRSPNNMGNQNRNNSQLGQKTQGNYPGQNKGNVQQNVGRQGAQGNINSEETEEENE